MGFSCSHCKDVMIDAITSYASVCKMQEDTTVYQLRSGLCAR